MPREPEPIPQVPETPVLLAIMRKRATEALELVDADAGAAEQFKPDYAVSYVVEWVGRCAAAVPETARQAHPTLAWRQLVEHRPALLENYRNLDMNEVCAKIRDEFPDLIAQLDAILGPEDGTP